MKWVYFYFSRLLTINYVILSSRLNIFFLFYVQLCTILRCTNRYLFLFVVGCKMTNFNSWLIFMLFTSWVTMLRYSKEVYIHQTSNVYSNPIKPNEMVHKSTTITYEMDWMSNKITIQQCWKNYTLYASSKLLQLTLFQFLGNISSIPCL